MSGRIWQQYIFNFADNTAVSANIVNLNGGAFGTLLVPVGINGKTLQLITEITADQPWAKGITNLANFHAVDLLTTPKALTTGKNAFSADEIREIGAAGPVRLKLNSNVTGGAQQIVLWWKD